MEGWVLVQGWVVTSSLFFFLEWRLRGLDGGHHSEVLGLVQICVVTSFIPLGGGVGVMNLDGVLQIVDSGFKSKFG